MKLEVTCSELKSAASAISKANEAFRDAAANLQAAAEELMNTWVGDSRDKFASGMEERKVWYEQMSEIVTEYVQSMNQIADQYEEMDQKGAQLVRK